MRRFSAAALIALISLCVACSGGSSPTSTPLAASTTTSSPVPTVTFGTTTLRVLGASPRDMGVETATTSEQSERGLGYRDALTSDAGMLFDLHQTRVPTFWMKGMRFALDMVWIGDDMRVAEVTPGIPPEPGVGDAQLRRYSPSEAVRYVLEVNDGAAARLGLMAGVEVSFALP